MAENIGVPPNVEPKGFWDVVNKLVGERLASPFLSAYTISWCVTNYKILLIVFGKGEIDAKLKHLDHYFEGFEIVIPWARCWIYGVPFIAAIFYIYGYPFFNKIFIKKVAQDNFDISEITTKINLKREIDKLEQSNTEKASEIIRLTELWKNEEAKAVQASVVARNATDLYENMKYTLEAAQAKIMAGSSPDYDHKLMRVLVSQLQNHNQVLQSKVFDILRSEGVSEREFLAILSKLVDDGLITTEINPEDKNDLYLSIYPHNLDNLERTEYRIEPEFLDKLTTWRD